MSFMKPGITLKQRGWCVETRDSGTCFVPGDVVTVPQWMSTDTPVDANDYPVVFDALSSMLRDYVEGTRIQSIAACEGYFARLSAPGYLDCTEWCCYRTLHEAREALKD